MAPRSSGGPPNDNVEECFEQVAAGVAACICPASMVAFYRRADLAWIPIVDIEPLRIALGWLHGRDTPVVAAFAQVVREVAIERHGTPPARLVGGQAA
jgi:DNA-binding transcriptional LysR family regulator